MLLCAIFLSITSQLKFHLTKQAWLQVWTSEHRDQFVEWYHRAVLTPDKVLGITALCAADSLDGGKSRKPESFVQSLFSRLGRASSVRSRVNSNPIAVAERMLSTVIDTADADLGRRLQLLRLVVDSNVQSGRTNARKDKARKRLTRPKGAIPLQSLFGSLESRQRLGSSSSSIWYS
jgi:hypothetical protein